MGGFDHRTTSATNTSKITHWQIIRPKKSSLLLLISCKNVNKNKWFDHSFGSTYDQWTYLPLLNEGASCEFHFKYRVNYFFSISSFCMAWFNFLETYFQICKESVEKVFKKCADYFFKFSNLLSLLGSFLALFIIPQNVFRAVKS